MLKSEENKFMRSGLVVLLVIGSAVAAFGLTFHFFGQSELVPVPSREIGFKFLAPVAILDRIYTFLTGYRLQWYPIPMFLVLWVSYSLLSILVAFLIIKKRERSQA
jgi:hypothetical protein